MISKDQWQSHFSKQSKSGISIAEYCRKNKLVVSRFYYWRAKPLKPETGEENTFVRAQVAVSDLSYVAIRLPNGIEIKTDSDIDSRRLGRIVNFLSGISA